MNSNKQENIPEKQEPSRIRKILQYLNIFLDLIIGVFFIWLSQTPGAREAIIPPWGYLLIGIGLWTYGICSIFRLWRKRKGRR